MIRGIVIVVVAALVLLSSSTAFATVRRFAVVVGNNRGDASDVELRYAESDAQRVSDVLTSLGGFEPADVVVLKNENAARVQSTLIAVNDRVRSVVGAGTEALLFVFYSGHADAESMHLATTRLRTAQLEQLVRGSAATFRVLAIDACRSGSLTRVKGGTPAAPFDIRVDEHLAGQGIVFLTSSSANEDAQESDALKGSFFTHHFVSALRGAADADADGRVTLEEAYRYAYEATLRSTSETLAGTQHPTFRYELQGAGKLTLTELRSSSASRGALAFPPKRSYLVMERSNRGAVVAEVGAAASARTIAVVPGRYFVRGRAPDVLLEGEVDAPVGGTVDVTDDKLRRVAYARLVRKGEGDASIVHGPDAGYVFHTALSNADSACHGAFGGYTMHLEDVSFGVRLAGCHASFANATLDAATDEWGGELRATHAFDLPVLSIEPTVGIGAWAFHQSFTTTGNAPSRTSAAGSLALALALRVDLGAGFSVFGESALAGYVYEEARRDGDVLGLHLAFRQAAGFAKVW